VTKREKKSNKVYSSICTYACMCVEEKCCLRWHFRSYLESEFSRIFFVF